MLLTLMLLVATPVSPEVQATDNPFAQSAPTKRPVRRRPAGRRADAPSGTTVGSAYYANCSAARAAGAAPVMRGQPGYSRKLDRDNDGVGCE